MCPTGYHISQQEIHGQDLVNLAIYRMVRPKAYIDEVRAYVHNQNPANPPYSQSQVVRAEQRLGLIRKAASTTSDCAYFQLNLFKRQPGEDWEKGQSQTEHGKFMNIEGYK